MKKLLTFLLAICMCVPFAFAAVGCGKKTNNNSGKQGGSEESTSVYVRYTKNNGEYEEDENGAYVKFGSYPQSEKASDVTIGGNADENGYYTGSDGEKYAKYDGNYYKVEPLCWRILETNAGKALLVCETIVDQCTFDDSSNNYARSDLRAFLNGTFLSKAFSAAEQAIIETTNVDNSAATTDSSSNPYACENTFDKVFALSCQDMRNTEYGFNTNSDRRFVASAYARAKNVFVHEGFGNAWLRSPDFGVSSDAFFVYFDGIVDIISVLDFTIGVLPALQISL